MRFRVILAGLFCVAGLRAQQGSLFPTPAYFRDHFSVPQRRVELQTPVRLPDFEANGKLELSLRSYLELVMANNTDVEIQKVTLEFQKNAITRAFARFDPLLTASFNSRRTKSPATDVLQGAATLNQLNQPANFTYQQTLQSGTQYNVGFSASKASTNSAFSTFNPALNAQLSFGFTQPLLRNRGAYITRLPVLLARSRMRVSEFTLKDQLLRLLATAENAYWDVVEARENVVVQENFLNLRIKALERAEREVQLGATSPLEIFRPRADKAASEIQVSQAKYRLAQVEDALRRQIGADLDPKVRNLPIVLTETVAPPLGSVLEREELVEKALALRPDLRSAIQSLEIDDMNITSASNATKPDLALTGSYASSGRGGTFFQRTNVFTDSGSSASVIRVMPGGIGDALDQLFGFNFPTYSLGLTLRLPLRDRATSSDLADALLQKRLNALRVRTTEQSVRLQVLNAISQVESSRESVKLAVVARDLAQENLKAEQQRFDVGVSLLFFVLDAQNQLSAAQSRLVTESVNYRRNLLNLLRVTGELLEERGVTIQ